MFVYSLQGPRGGMETWARYCRKICRSQSRNRRRPFSLKDNWHMEGSEGGLNKNKRSMPSRNAVRSECCSHHFYKLTPQNRSRSMLASRPSQRLRLCFSCVVSFRSEPACLSPLLTSLLTARGALPPSRSVSATPWGSSTAAGG